MDDGDDTLSMVVFSGTDDRLTAAATLVVGAAALGRRVDILLQFWGLHAFRAGHVRDDHGVAADAPPEGAALAARGHAAHWADLLSQAREIGDVSIHACAQSMEMLALEPGDLEPLVDDVQGVTAFMASAGGALVFI